MGTTSRPASTPEEATVSAQDAELLLREASALLPSCANARVVRAYYGVRPLLGAGGRNASRTFSVIHELAAENLLSVVGGKLTTYRLMAEKVSDQACQMLGRKGGCRTHLEELSPGNVSWDQGIAQARLRRKYGGRAAGISTVDPKIICSCEQVLRSEVDHVLKGPDALTLADVMRRTRAGMGYCQGLDCSLSVLEMMVKRGDTDPLAILGDFLKEREKGQVQASGEQQRQELFRKHLLQGVYGLGGRT
jgi:glycerol-3-phosphate dehydrogenase